MFTGIVEEQGTVTAQEVLGDSARLRVRAATVVSDLREGDSVSVNGVCLTVAEAPHGSGFVADVMAETLSRSTLAGLADGDPVNLERAVSPQTRLGGHIVQGHVDGVGRVSARTPGERWDVVRIELPEGLSRYVVEKGSVAVDGVSLTVSDVSAAGARDSWFEVSLIPTTLERTTMGTRQPGSTVNLEVDVIAKYVERLLGSAGQLSGKS